MLLNSDVLLWTSQGYIWFYEHTLQAASLSQILVSIPMFYFQFTAQLTTLYNWAMFTLLHRGTSKSVNWHMKCPSRPPVVSIFILSRAKNFYSPFRLFYGPLTANCGFYIYIFYFSGTHLTVSSYIHYCFIFHFMARRCLSLDKRAFQLNAWAWDTKEHEIQEAVSLFILRREEWKGLGWNKSFTTLGASYRLFYRPQMFQLKGWPQNTRIDVTFLILWRVNWILCLWIWWKVGFEEKIIVPDFYLNSQMFQIQRMSML